MCYFYLIYFKYINTNQITNFFKISGRYYINESFNYNDFNNKHNIFKKNVDVINKKYFFTSFYKLNSESISYFFLKLIECFNNKHLYITQNYEEFVPDIIKNKVDITNLGITQMISPFGIVNNI
jgi:hypothetical protein